MPLDPAERSLLESVASSAASAAASTHETQVQVARLGATVKEMQNGHAREIRALHSRVSEVKDDTDADIVRVEGLAGRANERSLKPAILTGAGSAGGLYGIIEIIKQFFGNASPGGQ